MSRKSARPVPKKVAAIGDPPPPFSEDEILDQLFIHCPPISSIVFLVDGRRLICEDPDDITRTLTFDSYERKYGESVAISLERILAQKTSILERACHLVKADPLSWKVHIANSDYVVGKKVIAYDRLQVEAFASHRNMTVIGIDEDVRS